MKTRSTLFIVICLALGLGLLVVWALPYFFIPPRMDGVNATLGSQVERAQVIEILKEEPIEINGQTQTAQVVRVELLSGEYAGIPMEMEYGRYRAMPEGNNLQPGDQVFVTLGRRPDGALDVFFVDFVRERALLVLLGIFVAAILFMARWKGLRSLLALGFSLWVIIGYIIPHILAGEDPVQVSLVGAGLLLGVTLYLTYGWNLKTHASVLSMILVLLITGLLATMFLGIARLNGFGSEEALFLEQMSQVRINLRGLLLGGIIIGALGVLDDLVTTQAAVVFELHHTDPTLRWRNLFHKAMRVGQDHVSATVNTLVLAYAGSSLPMLLLFSLGNGNYDFLLNYELVSEEIVRTLVGSLGLMTAVPLTTLLAIWLALYTPEQWLPWLGRVPHETHGHSH